MTDETKDNSQSVAAIPEKKPRRYRKRPKRLTLKQKKLLKALPGAASVSEAGRIAGYSDAPTAHRALKAIGEKMSDVLDRHGLTPDFAAEKCLKLLGARKTQFFHHKGIVMESREVDDLDIQARALDLWAKLYGITTAKVELDVKHDHTFDLTGFPDAFLLGVIGLAKIEPNRGGSPSHGGVLPPAPDSVAAG